MTALHQNPFAILAANPRDNRRRIVELAEEKALEFDHDLCQKARADLINPRTRLAAEISWLPGVSPRKAAAHIDQLRREPLSIRQATGLPDLAQANLMAASFDVINSSDSAEDIAAFIEQFADLVESLSSEDVLREINEDRAVSDFPEITSIEQIESQLVERRRYFRIAIKDALNRLSPNALVETMTLTVDSATVGGEIHGPGLIDDLVDSYALESQEFLSKEALNSEMLIKAVRDSARTGERAITPYIDKLEIVARNWNKVARPIQLSSKARGLDHDPSKELAYSIRSLAIDLFNEHDMLMVSRRLTGLLEELFAELPEFLDRVSEDTSTLDEISEKRKKSAEEQKEWEDEITFNAEVGLVFKDTLGISPRGITWKEKTYPLANITRVRWGGVRNSVNGIPTGTDYTVAFGDNRSESVVQIRREWVYTKFIDKLWRAVGSQLINSILQTLKSGQEVRVGEAVIRDDSIKLIKRKFFSSNEPIRYPWSKVQIWSADGSVVVGATDDKKTHVSMSYISVANAHLIEQILRMAFKKPGLTKLSQLLG